MYTFFRTFQRAVRAFSYRFGLCLQILAHTLYSLLMAVRGAQKHVRSPVLDNPMIKTHTHTPHYKDMHTHTQSILFTLETHSGENYGYYSAYSQ